MTIYFNQNDLKLDLPLEEVKLKHFLEHCNPVIARACNTADKVVYKDEHGNSKVLKTRDVEDFENNVRKNSSMNIYAKENDKVICKTHSAGYTNDVEKKHLEIGKQYTVERTIVHQSSTEVFLKEFPGISFNSVFFEDFKED